jgi:large subunit ribosomal protein L30
MTEAKNPVEGNTITVVQTKSPIGRPADQRQALVGLKRNKNGRKAVLKDTSTVRGMIEKVAHLVRVEA